MTEPKNVIVRKYTSLQGSTLKDFYFIEIEVRELDEEDYHYVTGTTILVKHEKVVYFNSRLHVNKRVMLNPTFCGSFTDSQILYDRDLMTNVLNRYGADIFV